MISEKKQQAYASTLFYGESLVWGSEKLFVQGKVAVATLTSASSFAAVTGKLTAETRLGV